MNRLLENGQLRELACGLNFAYILKDNSMFLPTEYKVLQNQNNGGFVKCMKMQYNGHVQLYYMINSLKPLSNMLPYMDPDSFLVVLTNLFADIIEIRGNGFLSCRNVELAFDKIFVDPNTLKVSLVYLPLGAHLFDDFASYENQLRSNLVKLINGISTLCSAKTMRLAADLANGMLSLNDLHSRIQNMVVSGGGKGNEYADFPTQTLSVVSLDPTNRVEIVVNKDSFVIGKNASAVDGVISFSNVISRIHCRIDRDGQQYTLTDLLSANGTFLNKLRLQPNQPHPIKDGDIIKLANSEFRVVITQRGMA